MYLLTIQGSIIPSCDPSPILSYGAVSLHSSAFAAGGIATGMFGDRLTRSYGHRRALWLGVLGMSAEATMLIRGGICRTALGRCNRAKAILPHSGTCSTCCAARA
jgi:hypothetical protein